MDYYTLDFYGLQRELPIVKVGPKVAIASLSLLGDVELTDIAAEKLAEKLKEVEFDYLVGPEVKVVPLLCLLSQKLHHKRFVVCRKSIKGYMVNPLTSHTFPNNKEILVLDGRDVKLIEGKKIVVVDDVISSGSTITKLRQILTKAGAEVVLVSSIFKQGDRYQEPFLYLSSLPVFPV